MFNCKKFLFIICFFIISCLFNTEANANMHSKIASKFLDEGLQISENDSLSKKQKLQKLIDKYAGAMNFSWNAKMAMGRPFQQLTKKEQDEYIREYSRYLSYLWLPKFNFNRKSGVKLTVLEKTEKINDTDENVKLVIEDPNSSKYDVIVRTRITKNNEFQMLNVVIAGINIANLYRTQFTSYMEKNNNDPRSIISFLKKQNAILKTKAIFTLNF